MSTAAILLCAGRPLFSHALEALQACAAIEALVVVGAVRPLRESLAAAGLGAAKVCAWTEGGRERQNSVASGIVALPADADLVAIHDARTHGAAIAALPLDDTLKRGSLAVIEATVPRAELWRAQTPQAFRRVWLEEAHRAAAGRGARAAAATDDAALVEALGHRVHLTPGDPMNFKITTPEDLELAESVLVGRAHLRGA